MGHLGCYLSRWTGYRRDTMKRISKGATDPLAAASFDSVLRLCRVTSVRTTSRLRTRGCGCSTHQQAQCNKADTKERDRRRLGHLKNYCRTHDSRCLRR
jgi:hypothetical protein